MSKARSRRTDGNLLISVNSVFCFENVGLADIRSWLNCLNRSNNILTSKKALGAYQRERKNEVWQIILLMEGFKKLFGSSLAPIASLRGLGLNLCNRITPLKRLFIHHASGV